MAPVFQRTIREASRDKRLVTLLVIFLALAAAAIATSLYQHARYEAERTHAAEAEWAIWLGQGEVNPHSAAHFGQYVFKPRAAMAVFDPGLTPWLGEAVWIEAHYQNPPEARPAETELLLQRFGDLSPAWVLQTMLPLLIILAAFTSIAGEREAGSFRLQLVQGASPLSLMTGKALAILALASGVVIVITGAAALLMATLPGAGRDSMIRALGAALTYITYAGIWSVLAVSVSAIFQSARTALIVLLAIWAVAAVLTPRLAAEHATQAHPTLSAGDFWSEVRRLRAEGVDGHDPSNVHLHALREEALREHGVTSVEELPFDFAGMSLQADEEYGNMVYDQLYGQEAAREDAQASLQRVYALASPLVPVRSLSMGLAGSDLAHHRQFVSAAEAHRRDVQRILNEQQVLHGQGQNFNNTVGAEFWASMDAFSYSAPRFSDLTRRYTPDAMVLVLWALAAVALFFLSARRLEKSA